MNENIATLIASSNRVVGIRQVVRGLSESEIRCVILATDADEALKSDIRKRTKLAAVKLVLGGTKAALGQLAGIEVDAAVIGILK